MRQLETQNPWQAYGWHCTIQFVDMYIRENPNCFFLTLRDCRASTPIHSHPAIATIGFTARDTLVIAQILGMISFK
jgi:hypothetical protein